MVNDACPISIGPERDDDPPPDANSECRVRAFEARVLEILKASNLSSARAAVAALEKDLVRWTMGEGDSIFARRMVLSARLIALGRFPNHVDELSDVANQLVASKCYRRVAQLVDMTIVAGYCVKHGRPESAWPALVAALDLVVAEIPHDPTWLGRKEYFFGIARSVWESFSTEARARAIRPPPYLGIEP